jgi:hypothetical protein
VRNDRENALVPEVKQSQQAVQGHHQSQHGRPDHQG